jgi:hypothetical protein
LKKYLKIYCKFLIIVIEDKKSVLPELQLESDSEVFDEIIKNKIKRK